MTWDNVPWFVGGGAQHSPEVARLLAYAATSGAEGIVTPGDLKVVPLAVPGASIRVLAGACLILNRSAGGSQQTYVGRNISEDVKGIAATGSGSGRSDLVIAQVKDPFMAGEPYAVPADVTKGPYIFTEIVPNVPASATASTDAAAAYLRTKGISGIPLAAVVLPASTGTVQDQHITSLRRLALPRESREVQMENPAPIDQIVTAAAPAFQQYPNTEPYFRIPEWATFMYGTFALEGIAVTGGNVEGWLKVGIGTLGGPTLLYGAQQYFSYEMVSANPERHSLSVGVKLDIPANLRGTMAVARLFANKGTQAGTLRTHNGTQAVFDAQFYERAI